MIIKFTELCAQKDKEFEQTRFMKTKVENFYFRKVKGNNQFFPESALTLLWCL